MALTLAVIFATWLVPSATIADENSAAEARRFFQGRHLFQRHCVVCHGRSGRGDGEWADGVPDRPRNFRTGVYKFRSTPRGYLPSDEDLRRTITGGVSGTMMPAFTQLRDSEIDAVIDYLKVLSPRWDDEDLIIEPVELPEVPDWFQAGAERDGHVADGKALFQIHCASCHGPEGKGDGPASKGLIDIWEYPIKPAILAQPHHKSGDAPADLYRSIALGLDGTPMLGFLDVLGEEAIWDLVAFIQSLETSEAP